jgi:hypothetical protein
MGQSVFLEQDDNGDDVHLGGVLCRIQVGLSLDEQGNATLLAFP